MKFTKPFITIAAMLALSGCAVIDVAKISGESSRNVKEVQEKAEEVMQRPTSARIVETDGVWVRKRAILVKRDELPAVFRSQLGITMARQSSLSDLAGVLSRETGMRFSFGPDVQADSVRPLVNAGFTSEDDLKTLLDRLTAQANMSWKFINGGVEFYRFDTKVFQIAALPGVTDFKVSTSSKAGDGSKSQTGQESTYAFKLDFWQSINNDIANLVGRVQGAKYSVSSTTGTITVTGTPQILADVESYVKNVNATKMRQVAVEVRAYTVENKRGADFGVQWDAVYANLFKDIGMTAVSPAFPSATASGMVSAILGPNAASRFANTKVMLQALSTAGTASMAAESSQIVLSGESVPVNNQRRVGYLSEVSTTSIGENAQTSLKQSSEVEGFSMTLTPHIVGGDYVQLTGFIEMSTIDGFAKVESGGQSIQTPDVSSKSMPLKVGLRSGETYVFALRQNQSGANHSGVGGASMALTPFGGLHDANESKKTTLVTVTTHIINPRSN